MSIININDILKFAVEKKASDIHILAKLRPHIRINGELQPTPFPVLSNEECKNLVYSILNEEQIKIFEKTKELDFSYGIEGIGRFRINLHYQRGTIGIAIRPIKDTIPTFEELGLPSDVIIKMLSNPYGLILICGPTGSGKSTTLASMIEYLNETKPLHIITIEDPIEYLFKYKKSIVEQRELGQDTYSFAEALKRVLRQDPDVVLIGEMRDKETIESALRIAETGHLVLSTLHTGEVVQAMGRIVNVFPGEQQLTIRTQLSLVLIGVIVQQLIPRKDGKGRVLATEIMVVTPAIRSLIREGNFAQIYSQIQLGGEYGMKTMNSSLISLYKKGLISKEDMISRSPNIKELKLLLGEK
ncbi:MAG: type IV pilus twitching motility protein PilT [Candidatus Omnitrophica bacterium]|nr:type IV pilus twitching motility protein PilT [Candidatus Omnitrophota bacterium]MCM8807494.1 type IV pilus twitching motility protein PilT [Candidatus Omnitrophota bacterium]